MKVKIKGRKHLCPIRGGELVKFTYFGIRRIVKEKAEPDYVGSFIDDLVGSDGSLNWVGPHSGSCG